MNILNEIKEPAKRPNFHRSYLRKYSEPSSVILQSCSLGFLIRTIKISASEPSWKKIYSEISTMTCLEQRNPRIQSFDTKCCEPAPKIEEKRYQRLINKPLQGGNLQYIT